jgi:hypothetical protein
MVGWSALVAAVTRLPRSSVVLACSLRRYTGLTISNRNVPPNQIIHLRLLRENPL